MKKPKMVKQRWIIAGVILLVILVAIGILYIMQQENIKAAANARKYTQDQLQQQLEDNRQEMEATISAQLPAVQVRDLTEEERNALREGTISREELIQALLGPAETEQSAAPAVTPSPAPPAETEAPGSTPTAAPVQTQAPAATAAPSSPPETPVPSAVPSPTPSAAPSPEEQFQAEAAELIAEVYVLREEYVAELDGLMAEARAEYRAKPESERTRAKLLSWASGYSRRAGELEKQCDARMDDIVDRMKALVARYNADTGIIDTLIYSYAKEKSIQKSLYIQELEKRGIV